MLMFSLIVTKEKTTVYTWVGCYMGRHGVLETNSWVANERIVQLGGTRTCYVSAQPEKGC